MDALSRRVLNRAALDRQMLLARARLPVPAAMERLVALQAQDCNLPYFTLWSRLEGFRQQALTDLMYERQVTRSSVLRGTQHMLTAADFLWVRPLLQSSVLRMRQAGFGRVTKDWDLDELAGEARDRLAGRTLTRPQIARELQERWPDREALALGWSVQALVPVVHPPPSGTWNTWGATPFALPEDWLGKPLEEGAALEELVRRYLEGHGPASVKDFQMWSGVRRREGAEEAFARLDLRAYRDENGVEVFDLPDATLPDPDVPAPVRFLPDLDNLLLAYADRTRVMTDEQRKYICVGAWVKATVLVDGHVRAVWTLRKRKGEKKGGAETAVLTIESFGELATGERAAIEAEAVDLLAFAHPGAEAPEIRFGVV
ncbi:winged helix DNA-binding domain-containing protein [Spirillospora sp. NPDC047279]|uniref:winged helix DNA-binding domain-containing protein n=1 Tax=Spirillospora sp. NPDC047279 TaxID=3155478 RepID=UPI0033D86197